MNLQNYEVGSTVMTPDGEGMVVRYLRSQQSVVVHTAVSQEPWKISQLEGVAAASLDTGALMEWLDGPEAEVPIGTAPATESHTCSCPCGNQASCYFNVRGGERLMHFSNGACRCAEGNCGCIF